MGFTRREFLHAKARTILAVETVFLGRLYMLFFIEVDKRRVHLGGVIANTDGLPRVCARSAGPAQLAQA